jgi:hypothetical protein
MMVRDGEVICPSNYTAIRGVLKGIGRGIQVYAAAEDLDRVPEDLVHDIITTFDDRILPITSSRFGTACDVDGDGRFTILLSSWLDHLGGGRYAVDGFVRVADLDRSFRSPFGNHCDMMYLSTDLEAGAHLRTVLAHEYMHAVIFSRKMLQSGGASGPGIDEEGWLDEALAHLAEDLHGFSRSWMIIMRRTCSAVMGIEGAPTCSCGGALIAMGRTCFPRWCTRDCAAWPI